MGALTRGWHREDDTSIGTGPNVRVIVPSFSWRYVSLNHDILSDRYQIKDRRLIVPY